MREPLRYDGVGTWPVFPPGQWDVDDDRIIIMRVGEVGDDGLCNILSCSAVQVCKCMFVFDCCRSKPSHLEVSRSKYPGNKSAIY